MKKVYVSGSSREIERISKVIDVIEVSGFACPAAWGWIQGIRSVNNVPNFPDQERARLITRELALKSADADLKGIDDADFFVLVYPQTPTIGAWVELGYALRVFPNRDRITILTEKENEVPLSDIFCTSVCKTYDIAVVIDRLKRYGGK